MTYIPSDHIDHLATCISVYGDNWKAYYAAAECAYWNEHGKLPEWACFIDHVEVCASGDIFVHKDIQVAS